MDGFTNTTRMKPMIDGTSARPRTASGRELSNRDMERANRDTGGMSAAEVRKAGEAIGRGNRTPYEPIPPAPGETARPVKRAMGGPAKPMKTGGAACGTKAMKTGGLAVMPKRGKKC